MANHGGTAVKREFSRILATSIIQYLIWYVNIYIFPETFPVLFPRVIVYANAYFW